MRNRGFFLLPTFGLILSSLLLATAAQAQTQTYSMSGAYVRGEGGLIRLPNLGDDKVLCKGITGAYRLFAGVQPTTPPFNFTNFGPPPNPITVPRFPFPGATSRQINAVPDGCIPGPNPNDPTPGAGITPLGLASDVVVNTFAGGTRGSFVLPTNFFSQPPDGVPNRKLVPNIAAIISLSTTMPFLGPNPAAPERPLAQSFAVPTTPQNPNGVGPPDPGIVAEWRRFREGAWTTQTGRAGLSFTWCNGNPLCTNVGQGGGGIMKYSNTDPNGFGGTASVVLSPGDRQGNLPILSGAGGLFGGTPNNRTLLIQPVQAPVDQGGAGGGDIGGKGYRAVQSAMAGGAKVYGPGSYMISAGGFLTTVGGVPFPPTPTTPGNVAGSFPGTTNTDNQFPWTTGMVTGRNINPTVAGSPQTFTWRFTGSDNRTPQGAGNIQMVAGSIRFSTGRGTLTPHINAMRLSFLPVPEPGVLGLLAAGGLLLFGATRGRRA